MRRLITVCTLVAATSLLITGCGGGGGTKKVAIGDYAKGFCKDFVDFTNTVSDAGSDLAALNLSSDASASDLADAKDSAKSFLDTLKKAVDVVQSKASSEGVPDATDGSDFSKTVSEGFDTITVEINKAKKKVADFNPDTDSIDDLSAIFSDVGNAFSDALPSKELNKFDELTDAFSSAKACDSLNS